MEFNLADLFECVADPVPDRGGGRRGRPASDVRGARRARDPRRARPRGAAASAPATTSASYLHNSIEHLETMLACYKLRAVPVNVNYRYVADELGVPRRRRRPRRAVSTTAGPRADVAARRLGPHGRAASSCDGRRRARTRRCSPPGRRHRDFGPAVARRPLRALHRAARPVGRRVSCGARRTSSSRRSAAGTRAVHRSRAPEEIGDDVLANRAQRVAPFLAPGDPGPDEFVALALGPLDARERAVVGARHAARRRQGRAVRRAATSTWRTCSTSSSASASSC